MTYQLSIERTARMYKGRAEVSTSRHSRVLWPKPSPSWHFAGGFLPSYLGRVQQAPARSDGQTAPHPRSQDQKRSAQAAPASAKHFLGAGRSG